MKVNLQLVNIVKSSLAAGHNNNLYDFGEKTFVVKQTSNHPLPAWAKDNQQNGRRTWDILV